MIKNIDFIYKIDKANKELKKVHDYILSLNNTFFKDCIFVYDTIKDFKENQTEYYQDFITANYED